MCGERFYSCDKVRFEFNMHANRKCKAKMYHKIQINANNMLKKSQSEKIDSCCGARRQQNETNRTNERAWLRKEETLAQKGLLYILRDSKQAYWFYNIKFAINKRWHSLSIPIPPSFPPPQKSSDAFCWFIPQNFSFCIKYHSIRRMSLDTMLISCCLSHPI